MSDVTVRARHRAPITTRRPKNVPEGALFDHLVAMGWNVTKRGWPDFFAWRGDEIMVVEAKPGPGLSLKPHQKLILDALARHGIRTFRFDPASGLVELGKGVGGMGSSSGEGKEEGT